MAEAVTQPLVTIFPEVGVKIVFARNRQFGDRRGVFEPVQIEILPEGRRTEVEHTAPVVADDIERSCDISGRRARQQNKIAVKSADAAIGIIPQDLCVQPLRVGDAAEVTAIFDPDFIPQVSRIEETSIEDMWEQGEVDPTTGKSAQYLDRPGLSQLVHDIADAIAGAGPTISADEVTVSMTAEGVLSIKASGVGTAQLADASVTTDKLADASVTTGKLADGSVTAEKLADGAITIDQIDTSTVTPAAIGAAAAEHVHDAADVTTGTLPVARGGTGVTTDDALFQKVVSSHYPTNEELLAYLGLS